MLRSPFSLSKNYIISRKDYRAAGELEGVETRLNWIAAKKKH